MLDQVVTRTLFEQLNKVAQEGLATPDKVRCPEKVKKEGTKVHHLELSSDKTIVFEETYSKRN